jgi:hypothetical protein
LIDGDYPLAHGVSACGLRESIELAKGRTHG